MPNKIYVLTQGLYENDIITASSDRSKLERYIEAVRKRNATDAGEMEIIEIEECDDSYLNNIPEDPIYRLIYKPKIHRFATANEMGRFFGSKQDAIFIRQLGFFEEERYITLHGKCKCISHAPEYIEVYVRCKSHEVLEKANEMIAEYLESHKEDK